MIVNEAGEKCTPKDKAREILMDSIKENIEAWIDSHPEDIDKMTVREMDLLNDQLMKQIKRVYKLLGASEMTLEDGTVEQL